MDDGSTWHDALIAAVEVHMAGDPAGAGGLAREAVDDLLSRMDWLGVKHLGRLLSNEIYRRTEREHFWCPRCRITVLSRERGDYGDWAHGGAVSRASRGENDAPLPICNDCGSREAAAAFAANPDLPGVWRTGTGVPGPEHWPLPLDVIQAEDKLRYEQSRQSELQSVCLDDLDPGAEDK
jgi:hypothetical protein